MDEGLDAISSVLRTTPERWLNLANMLPEHLVRRKPLPKEWSAMECLQHLVNTERFVFPVRTRYFLDGKDLPNYDPDKEEAGLDLSQSPAALAAEFDRLRADSLGLLSRVAEGDLARRANHEQLGEVRLGEMLHEWAAHDLMHTVQAERALMQPFILESGAWRQFFADHDATRD